jgi:hypothetical protein
MSESREHFDGVLKDDERSPEGFELVDGATAVLVNADTGKLVIMGKPNETHNCDLRGCGSVGHKIAEFDIDKNVLHPYVETQWTDSDD